MLATSEFGQEIHEEINLYVTNNRLNEASFRQKLDPISKNIIKNQNPVDLLFKDLKHFDTQNPVEMLFKDLKHCDTQNSVIANLILEVDIGKKKDLSKFLSQAPDFKDLKLESRLDKLHSRNEFFNKNNNYPFIPPPPPQPPQPPYVPPPPPFQPPNLSDFSNNRPPSPPLPLPPPSTRQPPNLSFFNNEQKLIFPTPPAPTKKTSTATNTTQRMSGDRLIGELEQVIEK